MFWDQDWFLVGAFLVIAVCGIALKVSIEDPQKKKRWFRTKK